MEHSALTDDFVTKTDLVESTELTDDRKRELLSQRFARTASNGDVIALERLWERCQGSKWVDIDYRDDQGSTPLICASCFQHSHIVELLLSYGASVNLQDKSGWTALMWATTNQNEELVRVLLEHGASPTAKTARGHTAMNIAASSSNMSSGGSSDSDGSLHRASESPSASDILSNSGDNLIRTCIESDCGSTKTDTERFVVGSPRSTLTAEHSAIGTPSKRAFARDSISAGQNVLSMLQASRSKPESRAESSDSLGSVAGQPPGGTLPAALRSGETGAATAKLGSTMVGRSRGSSPKAEVAEALAGRLRRLVVDEHDGDAAATHESDNGDDGDDGEERQAQQQQQQQQPFDWDTLQLDQMYVISTDTVPQFLHAVIKDIHPAQWLQPSTAVEHKFVPASMVFLAARFAHHLGTPDFLESFLTDTIASIIHEVQTHKTDPVALGFWMSNIQTLVYFLKRDTTLVQATSEAQGRLSECMQDAYALLIRAVERELEPLVDPSLLAFESMPELFADVAFEAEKPLLSSQQRLSSFFFGSSATTPTTDSALPRKSSDGRPLRRTQTVLQKGRSRRGSLLAAVRPAPVSGPASASGEVPTWITCIERLRTSSQPLRQQQTQSPNLGSTARQRPTSGDTFVSVRNSQDMSRPPSAAGSASTSTLFSGPSPRTVTYILECLLDLLDMCEIHPLVTWGIVRQIFCYLGSEAFNRVLTTREFCARSRAMQIRMNLTQLNDWVRVHSRRFSMPQQTKTTSQASDEGCKQPAQSVEALLYRPYFDPVVELLELLQCLSHLPDLAEYFETTAKLPALNILQQETAVANYRYEVNEQRVAQDVVEYLESVAKEVRDGQRADREKQSLEKVSRRSTASVFSERRTMDGRPSLFSFDMSASQRSSTGGGLVRFSADPMATASSANAAGFFSASERAVSIVSRDMAAQPPSRLSSEGNSTQSPSSHAPRAISRSASTRVGSSGRRGLLLPIARPSGSGMKPSARSLFAPNSASPSAPGVASRLSESLEPISETSSVVSRQRSHTTADSVDGASDEAGSIVLATGGSSRNSSDVFSQPALTPVTMPNTAPISSSSWAGRYDQPPAASTRRSDEDPEYLSASLRGPKGKNCRPESMTELLDSTELLPFAVPTSREWLAWWQAHDSDATGVSGSARSHSRDWSNETVTYAIPAPSSLLKSADSGNSVARSAKRTLRAELAPVVPLEFLNALSEIA
ncbi:hypothetical protein IW152_001427 [Coemansia sp. BCRC 34962]|nr:hypothetical protein IW152_001427 [Coemansia sp. BCRC 34962]